MRLRSIVCAALALLAGAQAANACEFRKTPYGLRVTDCKLSELSRGRYELSVDKRADPWVVALPNLRVTDVDATPVGRNVTLSAEIDNNGVVDAARTFEVVLVVSVNDPNNNGASVGMTMLPASAVPGLRTGAQATVFPGAVLLPNRSQDWDVCSVAVIDPPPPGQTFGAVLEGNESDNQHHSCTLIFAAP